jgi:hypothetical protein
MDNLTEEQRQALDDQLKRATAFEEMIRTKGWEYLKAYYQAEVQGLATGLLVSEHPIVEFENKRREIIGIRKLMSLVDSDLNMLANFRKKQHGQTTTGTE